MMEALRAGDGGKFRKTFDADGAGSINRKGPGGATPLMYAALYAYASSVRLLLEHGADPTTAQDGGFTPLHSAAQNGDTESAEALLEAGADRTARDDQGRTPADLGLAELLS